MWFAVVTTGLGFWSSWTQWPGAAALAPLFVLVGLIGIVDLARDRPRARPCNGPDSARRSSRSASPRRRHPRAPLLHDRFGGLQPVRHRGSSCTARTRTTTSMSGAAYLLNPPSHFWTYMADGNHVTQFTYPAASFLLESRPGARVPPRARRLDGSGRLAGDRSPPLLVAAGQPALVRHLGALGGVLRRHLLRRRHRCPVHPLSGRCRLALGPLRDRAGGGRGQLDRARRSRPGLCGKADPLVLFARAPHRPGPGSEAKG